MSETFKAGDKVVVVDGPQKGEKVRTLKNRVDSIFFTNFPVRIKNQHYDAKGNWYAGAKVCLRHANPEEIAAAAEKPLRRGDLVEYCGKVYIVCWDYSDDDGTYAVVPLDKKHFGGFVYLQANMMTRIGSIRKKIKRIQTQIVGSEK